MKPVHPAMKQLRLFLFPAVLLSAVLLTASPVEAQTVVQFEYLVVNAQLANRDLQNLLNARGQEGWELVQINARGVAVLKRPIGKTRIKD